MVEQINKSIVVGGAEDREKLISNVNEVIRHKEMIAASNEAIKAIIGASYEQYCELVNEESRLKKGKFSKQFKLIISEALEAKASEINEEAQEAVDSFELIKNKLI